MQSAQSCGFSPHTAPTSSSTTISASCRCPPRFSTRKISPNAAGLSGTRFSTPLLVTTSTLPSGSGIFVASPSRIWTFRAPVFAMFVRAFAIIAGVMSRPYTVPLGPTFRVAYRTSVPEPEPGLLILLVTQAHRRDPVEAGGGQNPPRREFLEPTMRVLLGNPEDLRNLVGGSESPVMLRVLQDVRRAPLREVRRQVIDDRLERLCSEDLALYDLPPITVPDQKGQEVHSAPVHLVDVCVKGPRDPFGLGIVPHPAPV